MEFDPDRLTAKMDLTVRLATRLAKALAQVYWQNAEQIGKLEESAIQQSLGNKNGSAHEELMRVWHEWRRYAQVFSDQEKLLKEASSRLLSIPIFILPPDPLLEYFTIGGNSVIDLFEGFGPLDDHLSRSIASLPIAYPCSHSSSEELEMRCLRFALLGMDIVITCAFDSTVFSVFKMLFKDYVRSSQWTTLHTRKPTAHILMVHKHSEHNGLMDNLEFVETLNKKYRELEEEYEGLTEEGLAQDPYLTTCTLLRESLSLSPCRYGRPSKCTLVYPPLHFDGLAVIETLAAFNHTHGLKKPSAATDLYAFDVLNAFFNAVVEALKVLNSQVMIEFLCGGLPEELSKLRAGAVPNRPRPFPIKFTRMWLSNIPLQQEKDARLASSCPLNTSAWRFAERETLEGPKRLEKHAKSNYYCLLLPEDIPWYLGCNVMHSQAVMDILVLAPLQLPRPLEELATRNELTIWLTRVLLNMLTPASSQAPIRNIRQPQNLVAFVGLLLHLHRVGYPGHWLSKFLKAARPGASRRISRPIGRVSMHKVRLSPWLLDIEAIIATVYDGLPFPVFVPPEFTTDISDIGAYEADFTPEHVRCGKPPFMID
ncbi:hypothetical protein OBBRIDRAFT_806007 [Obba rivulosa]|uniref:Uncharacterized protein n=1 Tax=Obba rivulosa TaxID=1052685 RepID=A0A8E2AQF3_9APHY|nr:hypothetical protein OBBRIDRAFT_806007 [Obba rivulosa]